MKRAVSVLVGVLLVSCAGGGPGEEHPSRAGGPAELSGASTPSDPTAASAATKARTPGMNSFVELVLNLPSGLVVSADTREEEPALIPGAPPTVAYFRSYAEGGPPHLFFFAWDGVPTRDRGPMKAVESWTVAVDSVEANVSRTSHFFGTAQEVLVAHFEGPPPARRRYMIYTTRRDRGGFEAVLKGLRFSPGP